MSYFVGKIEVTYMPASGNFAGTHYSFGNAKRQKTDAVSNDLCFSLFRYSEWAKKRHRNVMSKTEIRNSYRVGHGNTQ
jgi:hypothetical protein